LRSWTLAYSEDGTAAAASFWSVSDWFPLDCTGLTLKTAAVPVDPVPPGLAAGWATAGVTAARATRAAAASRVTV
jgi:hypothetical protein